MLVSSSRVLAILLAGFGIAGAPKDKEAASDMEKLWDRLGSAEPAAAQQVIRQLAAMPEKTLPFLRQRVQPEKRPDADKIGQWIKDLDSTRYAARQTASVALEKLGRLVAPDLRKHLEGRVSLEARRRVEQILEKIEGSPDAPPPLSFYQLRAVRAIQVLERVGSAEARAILETLAKGPPHLRLTMEATEAQERLKAND
jgi:hypothetical protein